MPQRGSTARKTRRWTAIRSWLTAPEGCTDRRGCLLAKATAELAWENDAVAARSLAAFEALLDSCRQLVEQAQRAGQVDPAADAAVLGGMILTTQRGLEALAKAGVDTEARNRITVHDRRHRAHPGARVAAPPSLLGAKAQLLVSSRFRAKVFLQQGNSWYVRVTMSGPARHR